MESDGGYKAVCDRWTTKSEAIVGAEVPAGALGLGCRPTIPLLFPVTFASQTPLLRHSRVPDNRPPL